MSLTRVSSIFRPNLFKNKVAVITGGATGIGRAISCELLFLGCKVMIASRKEKRLLQAVDDISALLPGAKDNISWVECNIRQQDQVHNLMSTTLQRFGKIDFLVNNGGGQFYSPAANYNLKGWNAVIETNLTGTFLCCKEAYHQWMCENGGVVVNIIAEMSRGMVGMSHSGAARAGVENITKTLAVEWASNKIRLNAVAPGNSIYSETAALNYDSSNRNIFERNLPAIPLGRLGNPEEISAAVCYLLSPAASFVTGTTLAVDGGESKHKGQWPTGRDNSVAYSWEKDTDKEGLSPSKL